jgi:hypothetical protein
VAARAPRATTGIEQGVVVARVKAGDDEKAGGEQKKSKGVHVGLLVQL